jgi:hypothetical protein
MAEIPAWLPPPTRGLIERTVQALEKTLGPQLESALLIGAAMNPARHDRVRAPEILAIVADAAARDLLPLCRGLSGVMRRGARVRVLTRRELVRSCDVFALEIADWKARHRTLSGADPLQDLAICRADLRRSIEQELRGLSRRIRNRVLAGLATRERRDDPHQAVLDGIDRLEVAAFHALQLLHETPPAEEAALLRRLAQRADADAEPLLQWIARIRQGEADFDPAQALQALLAVVGPAAELIDGLKIEEG